MKIYYFNDKFDSVDIFINDFINQPKTLDAATGDYFEIELKENQIPFIKVWESNIVLISGMDNPKN